MRRVLDKLIATIVSDAIDVRNAVEEVFAELSRPGA